MGEELIRYEPYIRLGAFLAVFGSLAMWELAAPRRVLVSSKGTRWRTNIAILVIDSLLVRLLFPAAAVGFALAAEERSIGLLHSIDLPPVVAIVLAFLALDLAIYVQHVIFHKVPVLWRLHRMHHADLDIDVTTGTRFHPLEILLSMLIKAPVIFLIGAPLVAVLLFELALNLTSMFNHSNVRLPSGMDRFLRLLLVTPDMHRVHHSIYREETDSNFGFNLPWWDRAFRTYRDQPKAGHDRMTIGIPTFREPEQCIKLHGALAIPFVEGARQ